MEADAIDAGPARKTVHARVRRRRRRRSAVRRVRLRETEAVLGRPRGAAHAAAARRGARTAHRGNAGERRVTELDLAPPADNQSYWTYRTNNNQFIHAISPPRPRRPVDPVREWRLVVAHGLHRVVQVAALHADGAEGDVRRRRVDRRDGGGGAAAASGAVRGPRRRARGALYRR